MTKAPQQAPSRTSYSFEKRGELPAPMGDFYRDAGLSRAAFEVARAAQIVTPDRTPANERPSGTSSAAGWREARFNRPDPHPTFAPPNRNWREESWFQRIRPGADGLPMTKAEFMEARNMGGVQRVRGRGRNIRDG